MEIITSNYFIGCVVVVAVFAVFALVVRAIFRGMVSLIDCGDDEEETEA